jgi:predicted metal-dependent phosphoesterase TrpH
MLIDLHTHTLPLSDDSELTPDELIVHAKSAGLDAICFTEHDAFWNDDEITALCRKHDFLVLPGVEMTRAAFVMDLVETAGGVVIVAHPFRRRILKSEDPENIRYYRELNRACENPFYGTVDALEISNARGSERQNAFSRELAKRLKLREVAGSDAHKIKDIGRVATFFEREVTTIEELIAELKAGRFRVADPGEIQANLKHLEARL